jgi:cob(I)alamin adenosyltransferase
MGHRLSKIYTRTGDDGSTGMADGARVAKDSLVIEVIGEIDELNCCLGLVLSHPAPDKIRGIVLQVQQHLFDIGGELSYPAVSKTNEQRIAWLETCLDELNAPLSPLKEFILPGGGAASASCHLARAVCRRAERRLVTLHRENPDMNSALPAYLNRLSDLLFVICRVLAAHAGQPEVFWYADKSGK